jgi:beta-N-acetylhexosaminidase
MPDLSSLQTQDSTGTLETLKARLLFLLPLFLFFTLGAAQGKEAGNTWTEKILKSLSLREKIAQLVQIRVPGKFLNRQSSEFQSIKKQIIENRTGGVVLFAGNIYESAILLNDLQTVSKLPLLVAADFERGLSFRIADTTSFPWTMALGATGSEQFAYQQGFVTGQESRALGVHWIFAPVVDVNNNPDNPVINIRSFGEDPALVGRLGSAFIRGAKKAGVLTTAKHFPGHGDTATDSHLGLAVVDADLARLEAVEFKPFKDAVEAGVDSIMTAHVAVPKLTDLRETPATLSEKILTDILRNKLQFKGLIVTDALEMGGITNSYWCGLAAIRALQAGADILLLPPNATVAINEVERAVKRGDISETRINQSVRKVLDAKSQMGLQVQRTVPINRIAEIVASPQNARLAQEIADRSITVVKDDQHLLPVDPLKEARVFSLVFTPDLESSPGAAFQSEMKRRLPSLRTAWCNARMSEDLLASIDKAAADSDLIVCSTMARLGTGQDTLALLPSQQALLRKLAALQKPLIWIAFGNPYVLRLVPEIGTYVCSFSYSDVSQIAAAKALAGEIETTGRMPVSIPGYSKAGDGLRIPKLPMELRQGSPDKFGLPQNAFEESQKLLEGFVQSGVFHSSEVIIGYRNAIVSDFYSSKTGPAPDSSLVSPETSYGLASLFKMIGSASAAMLAADSGILLTGTMVRDYLPELRGKKIGQLRIQELIAPRFSETDSSASLIDQIVARASGMSLDRFLAKSLYEPLEMKITRTNTGLSCRGRDLAVFAQMLLNKGVYRHRRYLKPETIARFTGPMGLWFKPSDTEWPVTLLSPSSFGHISTAGSALWIDPAKQLFIVLLATASGNAAGTDEAQRKILESVLSQIASYK